MDLSFSKDVFTLDPDYNLHWLNHDRIRIGRVHTTVVKFVGIPGTCDLSRYVNVFHAVMAALVVFFWMKYIWLHWKHKRRGFAHGRGDFGPPRRCGLERWPGPVC